MTGETEGIRRARLAAINGTAESEDANWERKRLESQYGQVWYSGQLSNDFEILGFMAPYVVVQRKAEAHNGSLEFQHYPRLYFNFVVDCL